MKRANLLVTVSNASGEVTYTCESFHINFDDTVTFFSSGRANTVPAKTVSKVELSQHGATWCPFCDQSIEGFSFPR